MLAKLKGKYLSLKTDDSENMEIAFSVDCRSKHMAKKMAEEIKQGLKDGKEKLTISVDWLKNKRSLDQNALMWALLTEYARGLNAGRVGGDTPEGLYYKALSKYGVAEFIMTLPEAKEALLKAFRVVEAVDARDYNGKKMTVFKCYYGSSTYDTKQMANLIDGILDDLSEADIDTTETRYLREEWRK
jgi:hypothetical protein